MTLTAATGVATGCVSASVAEEALTEALERLGQAPRLILAFASPRLDLVTVLRVARGLAPNAAIAGATTAGEITEQGYCLGSLGVMVLSGDGAELYLEHAEPEGVWKGSRLTKFIERREEARLRGLHASSTILLTDGLSACAPLLLAQLQNAGGALHEIVGGAAGDESALTRTLVGSPTRVLEAGAVAVHLFTPEPWGISVAEGFTPATASMGVTRAEGRTVHELDGKPAFEAYETFAESIGISLSLESAGAFLLNNPLAVVMFQQVKYSRAVLAVDSRGALTCNGVVPPGSRVSILGASRDNLVRAARMAASDAKARLGQRRAAGVLMFSSVARQAALGQRFQEEVEAVKQVFPGTPIAGFLTYGEIARYSAKLEAWHNSSLVIAAIPE